MKYLALLIALIILPSLAMAEDTKETRMQAAIAYEKTMPVKDVTESMIKELQKMPQLSEEDINAIRDAYDMNELREKMLVAIANHFTTDEIKALTTFYASPEGQSVMKKMPKYMGELMPYIQQKTQEAVVLRMKDKEAQGHSHDHGHNHNHE